MPLPDTNNISNQIPSIDKRLLSLLVCPLTKTRLVYDHKNQELISTVAKLAYPIRNGIPIMLIDEARTIEDTKNFG
jgi:uncharacterized protein YbaR (Trm112 family)